MHKGIVEINQVPTVVETWGRWIEETPQKNEDIILCIPGNPGVTGYYRKFLETLHEKMQVPVWIVGHGGHQLIRTSNINVPVLKGNENLYDVHGQIEHKAEFFRKYIPSDARVFLIGHSVGCYVCLHLLKNPDIKSRVTKSYFLFPTIEDMLETPNGKFLTGIISYITLLIFFLSWIFACLPDSVQIFLLKCYFIIVRQPVENLTATKDLVHPAVLDKVFHMAYDEMELVRTLDRSLLEPHLNEIKLYYGANDNWAPASYCTKLIKDFPGINAEICVRKFDHAFVLCTPTEVANMVAGWIEADK